MNTFKYFETLNYVTASPLTSIVCDEHSEEIAKSNLDSRSFNGLFPWIPSSKVVHMYLVSHGRSKGSDWSDNLLAF